MKQVIRMAEKDSELLNAVYKEISEKLGMDTAIEIYQMFKGQQINLIVTDASGNTLTVTYGPMNYIVRMNEKGSDALKTLLKALYNYHLAAKAYPEAA